LLHGARGSRASISLSRRAVMFAERGYVALIPDYTTFRDDQWNSAGSFLDIPCIGEAEINYILQQTLRDVRGAIRKILSLAATTTGQGIFPINPDQIYVFGVSHGAYTALQLVTMDSGDFQSGTVTIAGQEYAFSASLDDLQICETEGPCQGVTIPESYDLKAAIKGVSLSTAATLSLDAIGDEDAAAMLFFHGTCDAASPYWEISQKDVIARNITSSIPDFEESDLPCRSPEDEDYTVYGSQRVYDHMTATGNGSRPTGFFSLCGARHNLSARYGITGNDLEELKPGLMEYETLRFFAQLINGDTPASFRFAIDHRLLPASDDDIQTLDNHCTSVGNYGAPWPDASAKCPTCAADAPLYEVVLRIPFFDASAVDNERYPKISSVASQIESCPAISFDLELPNNPDTRLGHGMINTPVTVTRIFDFTGFPVPFASKKYTLESFLLSPPSGLRSGIYFIHLSNGTKKAYHIR